MLRYQMKIGLIPVRRDVSPRPGIFNWEKAEERGKKFVKYIEGHFSNENVSFVDIDGINDENLLYSERDVASVTRRLADEKVDALFFINCNFGNEEVVGQVAKAMGKPVLIWAPLDDEFAPDGMRYTDSQCGIFGISRQLERRNIPFSYIESCSIKDTIFAEGLDRFCRVVCMVSNFRSLRIAQVGMRPKPFCSVMTNESELLEKFDIQTIPINLATIIDKYNRILKERDNELAQGAKLFEERYEIDAQSRPLLKKQFAFVLLYRDILKEYDVSAISAECWTAMQQAVGAMPCTAYSVLADEGVIVGCESDFHGTLSMLLLACASFGKERPFLGEFTVRHPTDRNVQLLWHCGPFAYSLKKPQAIAKMVNQRQWFPVKDGTYTLARFDQEKGRYSLLGGNCVSAEGPKTFGTYLWVRFENLGAWERKLIYGPYIHHVAEISGDYVAVLREFCRYVPGLESDEVSE
jgi:L-fucose isomerase-like protein